MIGQIKLNRISADQNKPYLHAGPVIESLLSIQASSIDECVRLGGYEVARRVISEMTEEEVLVELDRSSLRGRAGGGFPTAHKWWLVSQNNAAEKYFICNANAVAPGSLKERFILNLSPHAVIEAVIIGAYAARAKTAFIFLPQHFAQEEQLLNSALRGARDRGFIGTDIFGQGKEIDLIIYRSLGGYVTGEETALMELIEGKVARPRGKPPLPTSQGLFGKPTVVNNLETLLSARYILSAGIDQYQSSGPPSAPGTLIFSLGGHVNRPGLYELPLGTTLRELIFEYGGGIKGGSELKAVFPGGIGSPVLGADALDVSLDYDSLREAGSELGSGVVIVIAQGTCMVDLATRVAGFLNEASCGKCQPCKDGTGRIRTILNHIERIDEKSVDLIDRTLPPSQRKRTLNVLNVPAGISYTDTAKGLDKVRHLAEFFKYRGDCNHSTEAANSIQSLLSHFLDEFEHHTTSSNCDYKESNVYECIRT